ncbi:GNAT family N-acetyltransferase [Ammoniphilus sp. CFH 90114]|uniref:GNAT family N-acetyltransferase n=1 Tax=Ammoniphilus sp. CFH 90114 TaxID=2493665 RepID=UPI001F0B949E|nr:GNAT family N-acetyltransferase [Ammoniphilus sp. CFH 90114]
MSKDNLQELIIRTVSSTEELTLVRDLEKMVWASDDPVPVHQTLTVVKNGGMVIGAFLNNQLIGFQYSFPGFDGRKVYLCSHSMGIHPDYRKLGIGEKLKLKQREEARRLGYKLITWTYDPLETVNGYLNLTKLGAFCRTYVENCYGDMPDILNAGLPSDRFLVEWNPEQERSERALMEMGQNDPVTIQVDTESYVFPVPKNLILNENFSSFIWVPVPSAFQKIKLQDMKLALDWRLKTREVFTFYLNRGWVVTQLTKGNGPDIYYYGLKRVYN